MARARHATDPGHPPTSPIVQKLHNEFKHDTSRLEQQFEAWVRKIVNQPSQRLKSASASLGRFTEKLNAQIAMTPSRLRQIQAAKQRLRKRHAATTASAWTRMTRPGSAWTRMTSLLQPCNPEKYHLVPSSSSTASFASSKRQSTYVAKSCRHSWPRHRKSPRTCAPLASTSHGCAKVVRG